MAIVLLTASFMLAPAASAGTYPMYQCAAGVPAVSPGWSVFGNNTQADTVLSDTCSAGGSIGVYVFTEEHGGVVTENGHSGSQVGLQIDIPGSVPAVTIHSISAEVIGSPVTGDDAFLGFTSAGQSLPGGAELPYGGGSPYTASESWTLPQGARDFEAYVNCSTDKSSTSCDFADATDVPALTDITLSLEDDTPPKVASVRALFHGRCLRCISDGLTADQLHRQRRPKRCSQRSFDAQPVEWRHALRSHVQLCRRMCL